MSNSAAIGTQTEKSTWRNKVGLAEMLKGGVIMDVINPEQARIAEDAGAVAKYLFASLFRPASVVLFHLCSGLPHFSSHEGGREPPEDGYNP